MFCSIITYELFKMINFRSDSCTKSPGSADIVSLHFSSLPEWDGRRQRVENVRLLGSVGVGTSISQCWCKQDRAHRRTLSKNTHLSPCNLTRFGPEGAAFLLMNKCYVSVIFSL